ARISALGVTTTAGRDLGLRPWGSRSSTQTIRPRQSADTMASLSERLALFRIERRRGPVLGSDPVEAGRRQGVIPSGQVLEVVGGLPAVEYVYLQPFDAL